MACARKPVVDEIKARLGVNIYINEETLESVVCQQINQEKLCCLMTAASTSEKRIKRGDPRIPEQNADTAPSAEGPKTKKHKCYNPAVVR